MKILASLFLLLFPSILSAANPTTIYLVWKGSFTQANIDSVKGFGVKTDQPTQDFHILSPASTWFYVMYVTTTTALQNNTLKTFESNGKIIRLKSIWIETKYEGSIGGNRTTVRKEKFNDPPDEYYKGFDQLK